MDMIIGNFKLSDYGLMLGTFDLNNEEEELGMDYDTIEEFVGCNPIPIYLGAKYNNKLKPQVTIIKNTNIGSAYFTEHECREILRQLTGFRGYRPMQIYMDDFDELYNFNIRVQKVSYRKVGGHVAAIILYMECDSQFAWSKEFRYSFDVSPEKNLVFINMSDDLNNYLYPKVVISPKSAISVLEIVNLTDNNWTTSIRNIAANEIITMDSKNQILQSSIKNRIILNDFNLHFVRLLSGKNELSINANCILSFTFQVPRKVGFL